jgi:ribosome maturation factor RimP
MEVTDKVRALCEPVAEELGIEIYDVERAGGTLRVVVDRSGGISLDDVEKATRRISRVLDEHDPVPGSYTLEVTSPGLERNLRTPAHFVAACGETVSVRIRIPGEGAERVQGTLRTVDDTAITLVLADGGGERIIPFSHVDRARTVFEWGPTPKPGGRRSPKSTVAHPDDALADDDSDEQDGHDDEVSRS